LSVLIPSQLSLILDPSPHSPIVYIPKHCALHYFYLRSFLSLNDCLVFFCPCCSLHVLVPSLRFLSWPSRWPPPDPSVIPSSVHVLYRVPSSTIFSSLVNVCCRNEHFPPTGPSFQHCHVSSFFENQVPRPNFSAFCLLAFLLLPSCITILPPFFLGFYSVYCISPTIFFSVTEHIGPFFIHSLRRHPALFPFSPNG